MIADETFFARSTLQGSEYFFFRIILHHDTECHAAKQYLTKETDT